MTKKTVEINQRARKILQAVVSEYLHTGDAVGSRTVSRRQNIALSPASIRNVMADLEEIGLLVQPHTSAGRVPTEIGLRFFIDSLLKVRSLTKKEKTEIRERCGVESFDLDEVVQRTSRMLAELTPYAGIVLAPAPGALRFRHIEFVRLRERRLLCILVSTSGHIENRLLELAFDVDSTQLERIHNYLNDLLTGMTLDEMRVRVVRELGESKHKYDQLVAEALRLSKAALDKADRQAELVVSGQANLIAATKPQGSEQLARMRTLLQTLEDKEALIGMLDRCLTAAGIQVLLGAENANRALDDSSVVVTPYGPEDKPIGAIAVIGPMRMNYGKVMSIVDFTADLMSGMISS